MPRRIQFRSLFDIVAKSNKVTQCVHKVLNITSRLCLNLASVERLDLRDDRFVFLDCISKFQQNAAAFFLGQCCPSGKGCIGNLHGTINFCGIQVVDVSNLLTRTRINGRNQIV